MSVRRVLPLRGLLFGGLLGPRQMTFVPDLERDVEQHHDDEQDDGSPPPGVHYFQEEACPAEPDDCQDDLEPALDVLSERLINGWVERAGGS